MVRPGFSKHGRAAAPVLPVPGPPSGHTLRRSPPGAREGPPARPGNARADLDLRAAGRPAPRSAQLGSALPGLPACRNAAALRLRGYRGVRQRDGRTARPGQPTLHLLRAEALNMVLIRTDPPADSAALRQALYGGLVFRLPPTSTS